MEERVKLLMNDGSDAQLMGVIAAVFAVIITIVLFALWRRRVSVGHNVLLTGLCDVGKTLIYARLMHTKYVQTHTSVKENIGDAIEYNTSVKIVDIPGHERLRYKYFDKYKGSAKGLVFVIDSSSIHKDIRDAAEYLYVLLSDSAINKNVPVLILCNKQDQTLAKSSGVIKTLLEKEINLLRVTKTSQLEATDASSSNAYLGSSGRDFEFSHLDRRVDFAECSAYIKDAETPADIEQLTLWLTNLV
ncbi:signal recognition particle receptor subunit beta isoform X2 [Copidosoma floridanum]|uniref:signal recognition particle receptor subunit beta isoform X2 n=1 Tax=Copidosoma floridanum TaxID=29053 RepID=UPI0006C9B4ED|nr:signal recognition particle receptor subunit beta isoform X2 [Copidosoma floridanum]